MHSQVMGAWSFEQLHYQYNAQMLQNYILYYLLYIQKQPRCKKKGATLLNMAGVKKLQDQRDQPTNGCDGIDWWQKYLIRTIHGNRNRWQQKLTWIVVIKNFAINLQPFLDHPLWFFTLAILSRATPFITANWIQY